MDAASQKAVAARATIVGIAQAALWIVFCAALLKVVPRFERIFLDFGAELPEPTKLVITLSHFMIAYWYLAILPICLWPVVNRGVVSALWSSPEKAGAKRAWYVVTWLVPVILLAIVVFALLIPLFGITVKLS